MKVEMEAVAEMLARNGVQWPNRSDDITDQDMLKSMWIYVLWRHLEPASVPDEWGLPPCGEGC